MYLEAIEAANKMQISRLHEIGLSNERLHYPKGPPIKSDGLYWIYTSYTEDELSASVSCQKNGSVNFSAMVDRHRYLNNVCTLEVNSFYLVYNGIGGVGKKGHGGLRERILEEFRGGEGTGSLAIRCSSLNDLKRWRVSYVLWNEIPFGEKDAYMDFSEGFERLWRIHYGWPLLCTK